MQVEFRVGLFHRPRPGQREEPRFAVRKIKFLRVEQGLIASIGGNGPLKRLVTLEPFKVHSRKQGRERGHFAHDFGGVRVVPIGAKTVGDMLGNLPIWQAARNGFEYLMQPLDAPLGARECAFLLQAGSAGENYIREAACRTEENILDNKEIELGE